MAALQKLRDSGWITLRGMIGSALCFGVNALVYWPTQLLAQGRNLTDMTTALDRAIPILPLWSLVYLGAYVFWMVNYTLMLREETWGDLIGADVAAKCVCGLIFLLLPTTNVRTAVTGDGLGENLLRLIYQLDAPLDLFPSIHCLESWICFRGILGSRKTPGWYQAVSFVLCVAVCLSTLFTGQHVVADVLGGILLAEGALRVSAYFHLGRPVFRLCRWAEGKIRRFRLANILF